MSQKFSGGAGPDPRTCPDFMGLDHMSLIRSHVTLKHNASTVIMTYLLKQLEKIRNLIIYQLKKSGDKTRDKSDEN